MSTLLPAALAGRPAAPRRMVRIGPGECHVEADPGVAVLTVLGSCIAVGICDPLAAVGGLNHFMLPESSDGVWGKAQASLRYGNFAIERLVNEILARGGHRARLEVKLFGGASLRGSGISVGEQNIRFAERYLAAERMPPVARCVGGRLGRRVVYLPVTGRAFVRTIADDIEEIATAEARWRQALGRSAVAGEIELFD